jgi:hypothetical protein
MDNIESVDNNIDGEWNNFNEDSKQIHKVSNEVPSRKSVSNHRSVSNPVSNENSLEKSRHTKLSNQPANVPKGKNIV